MKVTSLSIPRSLWGRDMLLISKDDANYPEDLGKMCCLGHLAVKCGVSSKSISGRHMPDSLSSKNQSKFPIKVDEMNWGFYDLASAINDDIKLKQKETERQLKVLFRSRGIRLTFTGKGKLR